MKKLILNLIVMMMATLCVYAQTEKGYWLIGGSVAYSSTSQTEEGNNSTATTFDFIPKCGYFISDNLAVGAGIVYLSQTSTNNNPSLTNLTFTSQSTTSSTTFAFAPFVRYYFLTLGTKAKLFGEGSFGVGSGNEKVNGTSLGNITNTAWAITAGPSFFLNKYTIN